MKSVKINGKNVVGPPKAFEFKERRSSLSKIKRGLERCRESSKRTARRPTDGEDRVDRLNMERLARDVANPSPSVATSGGMVKWVSVF